MQMIQPNCRVQFAAEDIEFVLSVLGKKTGTADCLIKLLSDELFHVGPVASLVSVVGVLTIGAALSVYAARRAPVSAE